MNSIIKTYFVILLFLLVSCSNENTSGTAADGNISSEYQTIEWTELIPDDDLQALLNPPSYISLIEDGSAEDQLVTQFTSPQASPQDAEQDRYQQALVSTDVKPEFDQQKIRIPGFIVPLEFNENGIISTFFLVPFFGACTHEPPPPPNQIIYSEYEPGKELNNLYDPVWITGLMNTSTITNDLATSAYSMIVDSISPYQ